MVWLLKLSLTNDTTVNDTIILIGFVSCDISEYPSFPMSWCLSFTLRALSHILRSWWIAVGPLCTGYTVKSDETILQYFAKSWGRSNSEWMKSVFLNCLSCVVWSFSEGCGISSHVWRASTFGKLTWHLVSVSFRNWLFVSFRRSQHFRILKVWCLWYYVNWTIAKD